MEDIIFIYTEKVYDHVLEKEDFLHDKMGAMRFFSVYLYMFRYLIFSQRICLSTKVCIYLYILF